MKQGYAVFIGTSCIDEYYEMEDVPVLGEKVVCTSKGSTVGGMIGNAAVVHASYGSKTYFIDFMNRSQQADMVLADMDKSGVDVCTIARNDTLPDPRCMIMLHGGERIIFVIANHKKDLELNETQQKVLQDAAYVYSSLPEILALKNCNDIIASFQGRGGKLALDIEEGTLPEGAQAQAVLDMADILFINSGGARKLAASMGPDYLAKLNGRGCIAVLTKGSDGSEVHAPGHAPVVISGFKVPVVDTTGAGDTFNASFIFGLSQGMSLEDTARFANAAAARSIGFFGPRSGAAGRKAVEEFLNNNA